MQVRLGRREFLAAGLAAGCAGLVGGLPPVAKAEARRIRSAVKVAPQLAPLVRFLEDTPAERLLPELAHRIRAGVIRYRELVAALLLAGVRNVQPRPHVGYKFHTVLVVHSCHLAALEAPDRLRWLPVLWAAQYFKRCQAQDEREGDWVMAPVDEQRLPPPHRARTALVDALERWDEAAADVAAAALVRSAGLNEVFEVLFRYAARDYRAIGHKAIFVANAYRTLQAIGPEHAEPVVRSLVYALLNRYGEDPVRGDHVADRPWRLNRRLVRKVRSDWAVGRVDDEATAALVQELHDADAAEAAKLVLDLLNRGVSPRSLWDGLFAAAAELVYRQPGIVALHAVTTTNAIHQLYQVAEDAETRRILLLQNASFLPLFRHTMASRGRVADRRLQDLVAEQPMEPTDAAKVMELLAVGRAEEAIRLACVLNGHVSEARTLERMVRETTLLHASDPHDYKLSSAVLEDVHLLRQPWAGMFLAASLLCLPHPGLPKTDVLGVALGDA